MATKKQIRLSVKEIGEFFSKMEPRHFYNPALKTLLSSLQLDFCLFVSKKRGVDPQEIYKELIDAITENSKSGIS
jgi:hypothetical protein